MGTAGKRPLSGAAADLEECDARAVSRRKVVEVLIKSGAPASEPRDLGEQALRRRRSSCKTIQGETGTVKQIGVVVFQFWKKQPASSPQGYGGGRRKVRFAPVPCAACA